jgi:hypothetical protein
MILEKIYMFGAIVGFDRGSERHLSYAPPIVLKVIRDAW